MINDFQETKQKDSRAIPLQTIIVVMVVIGFIISFILMYFMYQTSKSYGEMRSSTENYIASQDIAANLLPADIGLSPKKQGEKTRSLLFDIDYESNRNEISLRINKGMDVLISDMLTRQVDSSDNLLNVLHGQQVLTVALMCTLLIVAGIPKLPQKVNKMSRTDLETPCPARVFRVKTKVAVKLPLSSL